jgi:hypothetical protein
VSEASGKALALKSDDRLGAGNPSRPNQVTAEPEQWPTRNYRAGQLCKGLIVAQKELQYDPGLIMQG